MAGYIRQDVSNNITNGAVVDADDLDAEFDAVASAFSTTTGHTHDGTSAEGAPITVVGPAQDVSVTSGAVLPKADDTYDLGSGTNEWKDLYIDGVAYVDTLTADAGTVGGAAITTVSATQTLTNKTLNLADNTLSTTSAQLAAAITDETGTGSVVFSSSPTLTGTPTAPTAAANTNTTQIATTAHVFAERTNTSTLTNKTLTSPVITTPTITAGSIDNTPIGATTRATLAGTTGSFTGTVTAPTFVGTLSGAATTLTDLTASVAELNFVDGVTSAIQTQLDGKQPLDDNLTAVAGLATSGLVARTGAGTAATRSIAVSGLATIVNGSAVAGNPTVGVPAATQAEAEDGTDNAHVMTPLRVKQNFAANEQQIGVGQTWRNVSGSRAGNKSYQNTTGKPIQVATSFRSASVQFQVSSNNSTWITVGQGYEHSGDRNNCHVIVPNSYFYRVTGTSINFWSELR